MGRSTGAMERWSVRRIFLEWMEVSVNRLELPDERIRHNRSKLRDGAESKN
uniref:Uncharacterized protein n=1 Tax=Cucumis melo TaxID=3656 RepID=A0A9I9DN49_CUCME